MTQRDDDPLANFSDGIDDIDLGDPREAAYVIYGSLSNIDSVETTPEVFWSIFGTPNGKAATVRWLEGAIKKLAEIEQGMPE